MEKLCGASKGPLSYSVSYCLKLAMAYKPPATQAELAKAVIEQYSVYPEAAAQLCDINYIGYWYTLL